MIEIIEDRRLPWKVKQKLLDIVVIVLFAKLANADDWEEIEYCAAYNEEFLRQNIELENVKSDDKTTDDMFKKANSRAKRLFP